MSNKPPSPTPPANEWRRVAMEMGERIADLAAAPAAGPAGYYSMTPDQWRAWVMGQMAALATEHKWLRTGFLESLSAGPIKTFTIQFTDGTEVVLGGDEHSEFKVSSIGETILKRDDIAISTHPSHYLLNVHQVVHRSGARVSVEAIGSMVTLSQGESGGAVSEEKYDHDW